MQNRKISQPYSRLTQSLPREIIEEEEVPENFAGLSAAPTDVTSAGFHRSRERTRKSAVLRLLERKQAEREKERERESRARSHDSLQHQQQQQQQQNRLQSEWARDRSWARHPFSSTSSEYVGTKTYISIGPGKPTRIRENSPSKRNVSSPLRSPRSGSPAKKKWLFEEKETSLKSASLLRELNEDNRSGLDGLKNVLNQESGGGRKRSFVTQRTIIIGNDGYAKFRSKSTDHGTNFKFEPSFVAAAASSNNRMDLGRDSSVTSSGGGSARSSEERDCKAENVRLNSSRSSSFSNLSEVSSDSSSDSSSELSKRRESLERRFRERSSVPRQTSSASSNGSSEDSLGGGSASSRLLYNLSSGYRYHRAAAAAAAASASAAPKASPRHRRFSQDHGRSRDFSDMMTSTTATSQPQSGMRPRSRKISVPLTCYEHPERSVQQARRSDIRMAHTRKIPIGGGDVGGGCDNLMATEVFAASKQPRYDDLFYPQHDNLSRDYSTFPSHSSYPLPPLPQTLNSEVNNLKYRENAYVPELSNYYHGKHKIDARSQSNSSSISDSGGSVATTVFGESAARTEVTFLESDKNELIGRALASSLGGFEAASMSNASTVSGSGMNFFRKFVQRRGGGGGKSGGDCKDCESLFRREVLIDRLVSDAAAVYAGCDIDPVSGFENGHFHHLSYSNENSKQIRKGSLFCLIRMPTPASVTAKTSSSCSSCSSKKPRQINTAESRS